MQAAKAAFELTASLRSPPEVIMGWFSTGSIVSAVRLFQEWGVFDAIPALVPGGAGPPGISFSELAAKVEAEESLLVRVSWMLTSNSILKHIPSTPAHLAHTPTSMLLRTGSPIAAMFKLMYTNIVEVSTILPPYFNNYGRREPLGPAHIPCTFLAGEPELEYFQHINADPARIANFMLAMGITHRNVPTTGMYPMDGVLAAAKANPSRPIWVDVGGGDGHTVKIFRSTYGLPAEQCIIQDLPEVITAAQSAAASSPSDELTGVKFIPMDFHRDAPVPGARAYYLRHILRDYSDPTAVNILKNLKKGLTEADSRILIAEQVIEDQPPAYAAFKDFAMLAIGGKERTVEGFKEIAERAGLEVSGVFRDGVQAAHAVVEMRVKV
ncbi:O-methyltransferase-domain-containing protein [Cercophora newfieldiana]|uniref:O-methyltransferase-domain-containing protein n=1 Tax=Cercophora newfieldiana TaxID=92897 RepID=A0AA39XZ49_9PEZI|nr:O-methyltransferase-domain-containing protein [Cercophora newfieldiana]